MDRKILEMLEADGRLTAKQIALMLDKEEGEIRDMIQKFEADGVILGYKAIVDWDKTDRESVTALIEVKITPQKGMGFDEIARQIYSHHQVESVYLMSGGFDLCLIVEGHTMRDVAYFVAEKLATIDGVASTATHFVLQRYKDGGIVFDNEETDKRGNCLLYTSPSPRDS